MICLRVGYLVCCLLMCLTASAQSSRSSTSKSTALSTRGNDVYLKAHYRYGWALPEYSLFPFLTDDVVKGFNIQLVKQATGTTYWDQLYRYPEYGLCLQYSTLGHRDIFGEEFSVYPFANIPILHMHRLTTHAQLGMGIGIVTKKYDPETNPYNVAVGSTINLHFNAEVKFRYQFSPVWMMNAGVAMDHFSNGNLGEPNLGINTLVMQAGIQMRTGGRSAIKTHELPEHIRSNTINIMAAASAKHARALQDQSYFVSSLSLEWKRRQWRIFHPGIGVDVFYDGSTEAESIAFGDEPFKTGDVIKTGFHLSQELVFNKFSIGLQEGWYVGKKEKVFDHKSYHRFIVRQQFGERLIAQLSMKAHFVVLDYLEFGIGYKLKP